MKTKTLIGLLMSSTLLISLWVVMGCDLLLQPQETEYYSTLEYGEDWSLAMENADRNMINHLSCPNHNPNWVWCKIWRNNNAVLHSIYE